MKERIKHIVNLIYNFFPVQLLLLNFKKNQILLLFWFFFFSIINGDFAGNLGVPYLFLDPEYQHDTNFTSLLLLGISFAIFTISYFITCYILDSHRFNFLGTIKYPFVKYCLNNSVIPFAFIVLYLIQYIIFQNEKGLEPPQEIISETAGFVLGFTLTLITVFYYFTKTNRDVLKALVSTLDQRLRKKKINAVRVMKKIDDARKKRYAIDHYIDTNLSIKRVNQEIPYDKKTLLKIIDQHHLNAVSVQLFVFLAILIVGLFKNNDSFQLPAAASGFLFASFFIMFTGFFSYWLRGWAITGIIILLFIFNLLVKNEFIDSNYHAFGLNYQTEKADYSLHAIEKQSNDNNFNADRDSTHQILKNWRQKFPENKKPKMLFICSSGGGQRAALWTMVVLQHIDSSLNGSIMKNAALMTGASGGLIGSSYYRELYLRKLEGDSINLHDEIYANNISKDVLNPMVFSLVVSDLFLRFQKKTIGGYRYSVGRGYAFEEQLNCNLGGVFSKNISDYAIPEKRGDIPMLLMSPTIINDGRKLYISSQHTSYMCRTFPFQKNLFNPRIRGIDFRRFFEQQDADNLRFLSALRMSATFPYITPNVQLPCSPPMEIMDAGLSDNYGILDAIRYIYNFRDWIEEHTSGVVIISIRDSEKNPDVKSKDAPSLWSKVFNPIGSLYTNWDFLQDFSNDMALDYSSEWFDNEIDLVTFQYVPRPKNWKLLEEKNINPENLEKERASLSWHLTKREKESIKRTIHEDYNVAALNKLRQLLHANE